MKLRIISAALCVVIPISTIAFAPITIDPGLTAAIVAQTTALNGVYKTRTKKQNAIIAAETAITATMTEVHKIESKVLEYLSNAQGAVQNLHQIKRAAELSAIEIPRNIKALSSAVPRNIKGTAIATVVSSELTNAATEAASLYPLIAQLVTSGSYNSPNGDGTSSKKKVNLLDAAERYYIANEVVRRLESINMDLYLLTWQVQTLSFQDLFFHLTPDSWYNIMAGKYLIQDIIREYAYL